MLQLLWIRIALCFLWPWHPPTVIPLVRIPMVIQILRGCYNWNPPNPRYNSFGDHDIIRNFFYSLGPDSGLELLTLLKKLAMLLALATFSRVSELFDFSFFYFNFRFLPPSSFFPTSKRLNLQVLFSHVYNSAYRVVLPSGLSWVLYFRYAWFKNFKRFAPFLIG